MCVATIPTGIRMVNAQFGTKPSYCPLKQIPEKIENIEGFNDIDLQWQADSYCDGWNACVDEILGGKQNETKKIYDIEGRSEQERI